MAAGFKIITDDDYADSFDAAQAFALDVLVGLSETRKSLPSKHLYDKRGSELFARITELKEYYPTNCEIEILETQGDKIASYVTGQPFNMVELGAGSGEKTRSF